MNFNWFAPGLKLIKVPSAQLWSVQKANSFVEVSQSSTTLALFLKLSNTNPIDSRYFPYPWIKSHTSCIVGNIVPYGNSNGAKVANSLRRVISLPPVVGSLGMLAKLDSSKVSPAMCCFVTR